MERRTFLAGLGALVGGVLLDQAIPFNRVWSFPKKIVIPVFHTPFPDEYFKNSPLLVRLKGLNGMPYWLDPPPHVGPYMGISREPFLPVPVIPAVVHDWVRKMEREVQRLTGCVPQRPISPRVPEDSEFSVIPEVS